MKPAVASHKAVLKGNVLVSSPSRYPTKDLIEGLNVTAYPRGLSDGSVIIALKAKTPLLPPIILLDKQQAGKDDLEQI